MFKNALNFVLVLCFLLNTVDPLPQARAEGITSLPVPGTRVSLSPAYTPVLMKGIRVHPENPFKFDFIMDTGDDKGVITDSSTVIPVPDKSIRGQAPAGIQSVIASSDEVGTKQSFKDESNRLIKYFLAALTVPEQDLWVNLSPYEKDRMIADNLRQTEMGRDLLAQDYMLKQITASLIYPEKDLGKEFWDKVYAKAQQMYGTTEVPVNTFNKVWIVADKADVFERNNTAYVIGAHLKVMLEEDYKGTAANSALGGVLPQELGAVPSRSREGTSGSRTATLASQIIKEIVLPQLEQEVNEGQNFAPLRQMYYSMILASWFKMALKDAVISKLYGNKSKLAGLSGASGDGKGVIARSEATKQSLTPESIYDRYLQAYKKGVFNYIKEDGVIASGDGKGVIARSEATKQSLTPEAIFSRTTTPRKYFSGGTSFAMLADPTVLSRRTFLRMSLAALVTGKSILASISLRAASSKPLSLSEIQETVSAVNAVLAKIDEENKDLLFGRLRYFIQYDPEYTWAQYLADKRKIKGSWPPRVTTMTAHGLAQGKTMVRIITLPNPQGGYKSKQEISKITMQSIKATLSHLYGRDVISKEQEGRILAAHLFQGGQGEGEDVLTVMEKKGRMEGNPLSELPFGVLSAVPVGMMVMPQGAVVYQVLWLSTVLPDFAKRKGFRIFNIITKEGMTAEQAEKTLFYFFRKKVERYPSAYVLEIQSMDGSRKERIMVVSPATYQTGPDAAMTSPGKKEPVGARVIDDRLGRLSISEGQDVTVSSSIKFLMGQNPLKATVKVVSTLAGAFLVLDLKGRLLGKTFVFSLGRDMRAIDGLVESISAGPDEKVFQGKDWDEVAALFQGFVKTTVIQGAAFLKKENKPVRPSPKPEEKKSRSPGQDAPKKEGEPEVTIASLQRRGGDPDPLAVRIKGQIVRREDGFALRVYPKGPGDDQGHEEFFVLSRDLAKSRIILARLLEQVKRSGYDYQMIPYAEKVNYIRQFDMGVAQIQKDLKTVLARLGQEDRTSRNAAMTTQEEYYLGVVIRAIDGRPDLIEAIKRLTYEDFVSKDDLLAALLREIFLQANSHDLITHQRLFELVKGHFLGEAGFQFKEGDNSPGGFPSFLEKYITIEGADQETVEGYELGPLLRTVAGEIPLGKIGSRQDLYYFISTVRFLLEAQVGSGQGLPDGNDLSSYLGSINDTVPALEQDIERFAKYLDRDLVVPDQVKLALIYLLNNAVGVFDTLEINLGIDISSPFTDVKITKETLKDLKMKGNIVRVIAHSAVEGVKQVLFGRVVDFVIEGDDLLGFTLNNGDGLEWNWSLPEEGGTGAGKAPITLAVLKEDLDGSVSAAGSDVSPAKTVTLKNGAEMPRDKVDVIYAVLYSLQQTWPDLLEEVYKIAKHEGYAPEEVAARALTQQSVIREFWIGSSPLKLRPAIKNVVVSGIKELTGERDGDLLLDQAYSGHDVMGSIARGIKLMGDRAGSQGGNMEGVVAYFLSATFADLDATQWIKAIQEGFFALKPRDLLLLSADLMTRISQNVEEEGVEEIILLGEGGDIRSFLEEHSEEIGKINILDGQRAGRSISWQQVDNFHFGYAIKYQDGSCNLLIFHDPFILLGEKAIDSLEKYQTSAGETALLFELPLDGTFSDDNDGYVNVFSRKIEDNVPGAQVERNAYGLYLSLSPEGKTHGKNISGLVQEVLEWLQKEYGDAAMTTTGGIDLDRGKMDLKVHRDAKDGFPMTFGNTRYEGTETPHWRDPGNGDIRNDNVGRAFRNDNGTSLTVDPALIERMRSGDYTGLEFHIETIVPITNLPLLLGLKEEEMHERLEGG